MSEHSPPIDIQRAMFDRLRGEIDSDLRSYGFVRVLTGYGLATSTGLMIVGRSFEYGDVPVQDRQLAAATAVHHDVGILPAGSTVPAMLRVSTVEPGGHHRPDGIGNELNRRLVDMVHIAVYKLLQAKRDGLIPALTDDCLELAAVDDSVPEPS